MEEFNYVYLSATHKIHKPQQSFLHFRAISVFLITSKFEVWPLQRSFQWSLLQLPHLLQKLGHHKMLRHQAKSEALLLLLFSEIGLPTISSVLLTIEPQFLTRHLEFAVQSPSPLHPASNLHHTVSVHIRCVRMLLWSWHQSQGQCLRITGFSH